jgi:hypothetical protein
MSGDLTIMDPGTGTGSVVMEAISSKSEVTSRMEISFAPPFSVLTPNTALLKAAIEVSSHLTGEPGDVILYTGSHQSVVTLEEVVTEAERHLTGTMGAIRYRFAAATASERIAELEEEVADLKVQVASLSKVSNPSRREIFMQNGRYVFCAVLWTGITDGMADRLLCRTPDGREFSAKQGYGTWCEIDERTGRRT